MTVPAGDMRVLLVTKGLDLGGIERMVVDLALGLTAQGVDVEVAVVNSRRDRLAPALDAAGITLHRLDGTDTIGIRGAAPPRPPGRRLAVRRRARPRPIACGRGPARHPRAPTGHHLSHPLGFAATADPRCVARLRRASTPPASRCPQPSPPHFPPALDAAPW